MNFEALEKVNQTLKSSIEELDDLIAATEQKIYDLKLGVPADVKLEKGFRLAFKRFKKEWCFVVIKSDKKLNYKHSSFKPENLDNQTPLLESSLHQKKLAVDKFQILIDILVTEAEKELVEIKEALACVQGILRDFDQAGV